MTLSHQRDEVLPSNVAGLLTLNGSTQMSPGITNRKGQLSILRRSLAYRAANCLEVDCLADEKTRNALKCMQISAVARGFEREPAFGRRLPRSA